ncbi:MAG: type III-B CRISPR module RAMP protein Cmr4 [Synergistaceae bacterium]|jgi:CRISPR-associated protein Cmr4|nr:type III-B CRISPR module RAMP protein Cmr4 [Synergistaceae bacterium]
MEKNYWLHVISPLHVGAGRGVGYIDLPIVREKATNWPYIPGSAVKGVLRQYAVDTRKQEDPKKEKIDAAFGQGGDSDSSAGALVFSDAFIVCLPVRSFYGTFAWITSPLALRRFRRRADFKNFENIPEPTSDQAVVAGGNGISPQSQGDPAKVYLEDIDLNAEHNDGAISGIAEFLSQGVFPDDESWRSIFKRRFAVVHDDIFTFMCETGTEVSARIRIDDNKKAVAKGALWYEESLPVETILTGTVWCDKVYGNLTPEDVMKEFCDSSTGSFDLQIGGKATTGKGRVRCLFSRD